MLTCCSFSHNIFSMQPQQAENAAPITQLFSALNNIVKEYWVEYNKTLVNNKDALKEQFLNKFINLLEDYEKVEKIDIETYNSLVVLFCQFINTDIKCD